MKIAVISDSHNVNSAIQAVKPYISGVDIVLHLGDGAADIKEITMGFKGEVYGVKGNCDFCEGYPNEKIIKVLDKKILMCHGHIYNVKMELNTIMCRGKELGVDIILFGHSHLCIIEKQDGLLLMNPGSIFRGAGIMRRSLGYLEIEEGKEAVSYIKEIK
ncbi:YfcE family phosphodiesterase [Clostridium gasigenes]|uniref:YfcE family phosphodiesterase n=1 Tax=Clostridium gasigenes TaxID=94869 RepID=UPI0014384327|nr:metallophosphoesterase [Clostridium gasigenes]MBU3104691.1 metallophosphoesterase [Clostridium gasigenes]NKF07902.1 metallophosphoesterase [Clostridium gasigenes]QSW20332.1 metallophosphoesterase [Clostridium gasigenes]